MKYLNLLLVFAPTAIVGALAGAPPTLLFLASALAVIPAAGILGRATEALAAHTGPRLGGLLNATLGNAAEHVVAVQAAWKDKMELSMAVSVGSSLQIALFVAPVLVFVSLLMGHPLTLVFNPVEVVVLFAGVLIAAFVSQDGETNWLEGAQLLCVYAILALAFFFIPAQAPVLAAEARNSRRTAQVPASSADGP